MKERMRCAPLGVGGFFSGVWVFREGGVDEVRAAAR